MTPSRAARQLRTFDDYLRIEEESTVRHEFLDGQVWAMAGGSPRHSRVSVNVRRLLGNCRAERKCQVYDTDLRIRVQETGLATYPDASVICGRVALDPDDDKGQTAVNPTLLVEVLSPSTETYDRGEKLSHYKRISFAARGDARRVRRGARRSVASHGARVDSSPSTKGPRSRSRAATARSRSTRSTSTRSPDHSRRSTVHVSLWKASRHPARSAASRRRGSRL